MLKINICGLLLVMGAVHSSLQKGDLAIFYELGEGESTENRGVVEVDHDTGRFVCQSVCLSVYKVIYEVRCIALGARINVCTPFKDHYSGTQCDAARTLHT